MTLNAYLSIRGMTHADFAAVVGGVSEHGVRKWARGERLPRRKALQKIAQVTGGEVTAADFLNMTAVLVPEDVQ